MIPSCLGIANQYKSNSVIFSGFFFCLLLSLFEEKECETGDIICEELGDGKNIMKMFMIA